MSLNPDRNKLGQNVAFDRKLNKECHSPLVLNNKIVDQETPEGHL